MTLYDRRKNKLIEALKDKKYREAYVEESIRVGIPFQIKTLRDQRNWRQKDLEKNSGIKQARLSLLEDPNYPGFSLATLKKLASAFDVGIIVRFVPFSELVEWELNLSSDSLGALSFTKEPFFQERGEDLSSLEKIPIPRQGKSEQVSDLTQYRESKEQNELIKLLRGKESNQRRELLNNLGVQ